MEVEEGEIVALIGANGAGKTTMLMTISGMLRARSGLVEFSGKRIDGLKPHEIVRLGISQVPEGRRIFPGLTVLENIELGGFMVKDKKELLNRIEMVYAYFPVLKERSSQFGGTLSGGEQQMLAIGRALMARPRLLLLDEPSLGLAPLMVARIFEIIRKINNEGNTILLVEQNARAALELAHRGYVMETGRIVMTDRAERLLQDSRVRETYLGERGLA
ncbi:MAG: ABC transporter ATP-binding protein [Nitrospirae bacterium]|nr:ABC transporter ATP-binding protein [Nitrospirota bacterium]